MRLQKNNLFIISLLLAIVHMQKCLNTLSFTMGYIWWGMMLTDILLSILI